MHDSFRPADCSLPGFSVPGILQARVLEWVAISFSKESSQPRDRNQVSHIVDRCLRSELLRGKLGLILMGGAILSKSLIQFSVDGRDCFHSLLFDLRPNPFECRVPKNSKEK